ncbi:MAG: IclR family transcriptional regulator [Rhodobacteraceae bacterium]|nr:IclR family transcriptional regulator [Paracoccaceae bacterium]
MDDAYKSAGTVGKALEVLDQVATFGRPVRFAELLATSRFPKATLYRFVQTLTSEGMLVFDQDRQTYALGVRLVRLAHAAWETSSLAPVARSHLDALSARMGETVHLAQLDNASVLYVDKVNARDPVPMFSQAGKVGPAYCTGVGKAMLAFLPPEQLSNVIRQQSFHRFTPSTVTSEFALRTELEEIREQGFAMDREEHEPGIICVAVPILTGQGRVLGALSVTSSTSRSSLKVLEGCAPTIRDTAHQISEEAVAWRFPDTVSI